MTEEFKILSEREHALERPGMYIGSTSLEDQLHLSFRDGHSYLV